MGTYGKQYKNKISTGQPIFTGNDNDHDDDDPASSLELSISIVIGCGCSEASEGTKLTTGMGEESANGIGMWLREGRLCKICGNPGPIEIVVKSGRPAGAAGAAGEGAGAAGEGAGAAGVGVVKAAVILANP